MLLTKLFTSEGALCQLKPNRISKFTTKFQNVQIVLTVL